MVRVYLNVILRGSVLGQGFPKTNSREYFSNWKKVPKNTGLSLLAMMTKNIRIRTLNFSSFSLGLVALN